MRKPLILALLIMMLGSGCGDDDDNRWLTEDAAADNEPLSCHDFALELEELVDRTDNTCRVDADCILTADCVIAEQLALGKSAHAERDRLLARPRDECSGPFTYPRLRARCIDDECTTEQTDELCPSRCELDPDAGVPLEDGGLAPCDNAS